MVFVPEVPTGEGVDVLEFFASIAQILVSPAAIIAIATR